MLLPLHENSLRHGYNEGGRQDLHVQTVPYGVGFLLLEERSRTCILVQRNLANKLQVFISNFKLEHLLSVEFKREGKEALAYSLFLFSYEELTPAQYIYSYANAD